MRKWITFMIVALALAFATSAFAGMGYVSAKSNDVDIKLFGSEQMWPTFIHNADFNKDATALDKIGRENGYEKQFDIRNQFRMGWAIKGDKWTGMFILEDDVSATKSDIDRAEDGGHDSSDFGLEKLEFTYAFSKYFVWEMGWNGKALDVKTGGLVYCDDHPFIGFRGAGENWKYEILFLSIRNDGADAGTHIRPGSRFTGVQDNLFAYTAKLYYTFDTGSGKLTVAPFFALQDNQIARANAYYFGLEVFGKLGVVVPRFEVVYVTGTQDGVLLANGTTKDLDIDAWAGFWSFEFDLDKAFKPYFGMWYISGDGNGNDGDAEDFQGITNIAKFTPTFGMGYGDSLTDTNLTTGTVLYSINPTLLPLWTGAGMGYGAIGGSGRTGSPGVVFYGLGFKGDLSDVVAKGVSYKLQGYYIEYEDTGALEDYGLPSGKASMDEEMGWGIALNLKYQINKHFYIMNTTNIFDPGDGIEDFWGDDYDDTMYTTTFEFAWKW